MLKIENRGYHGNGGVDPKYICIFVRLSTEVKKQAKFQENLFFLFPDHNGGCLMVTMSDS